MPHLNALENVCLPLEIQKRKNASARAEECLKMVGLDHRLEHLPKQLSGGECQRVAIARAMALNPPILLADEPSGNLDAETGLTVTNLLFELVKQENCTLLLVTHDRDLAQKSSQQVELGFRKPKHSTESTLSLH